MTALLSLVNGTVDHLSALAAYTCFLCIPTLSLSSPSLPLPSPPPPLPSPSPVADSVTHSNLPEPYKTILKDQKHLVIQHKKVSLDIKISNG